MTIAVEKAVEVGVLIIDALIDLIGPEKVKAMVDHRVALMASLAAEAAEDQKFK